MNTIDYASRLPPSQPPPRRPRKPTSRLILIVAVIAGLRFVDSMLQSPARTSRVPNGVPFSQLPALPVTAVPTTFGNQSPPTFTSNPLNLPPLTPMPGAKQSDNYDILRPNPMPAFSPGPGPGESPELLLPVQKP